MPSIRWFENHSLQQSDLSSLTCQYFSTCLLLLCKQSSLHHCSKNAAQDIALRPCVLSQLACMLQACYPAEVGSSSFMWTDRSKSTTQMELGLAQRQAEAISTLYARLNTHVPDMVATEAAGEAAAQSAITHVQDDEPEPTMACTGRSAARTHIVQTLLICVVGSPGSSDHSAATFGSLGICHVVKLRSQATADATESTLGMHRRVMDRQYEVKSTRLPQQLSSRGFNIGHRQAKQ